jgi:hypothetical protein
MTIISYSGYRFPAKPHDYSPVNKLSLEEQLGLNAGGCCIVRLRVSKRRGLFESNTVKRGGVVAVGGPLVLGCGASHEELRDDQAKVEAAGVLGGRMQSSCEGARLVLTPLLSLSEAQRSTWRRPGAYLKGRGRTLPTWC